MTVYKPKVNRSDMTPEKHLTLITEEDISKKDGLDDLIDLLEENLTEEDNKFGYARLRLLSSNSTTN